MDIEWIAEDDGNTIGHASRIKINGITSISPVHALTSRDIEITSRRGKDLQLAGTNIVVAGESLGYTTFEGVGQNPSVTEALFKRLKDKMIEGKINLIHPRISKEYISGNRTIPVERVNELQASGLVGIQLEAKASALIPPLNSDINSFKNFKTVYERTKIENQTYRQEKEIIGYIPTTTELALIPEMVKTYIKDGIRFFAVDFSSSPLNRWLMRTVVTSIRTGLKIKGKIKEQQEKQYYLHVFDVAPNKKTMMPVSPITDILTHAYGADSTSGVIWGGGNLIKEKLRYYNTQDYGAYQIGNIDKFGIGYDKALISGSAMEVYEKLRVNRLVGYKNECERITQTMSNGNGSGYAPYLTSKTRANKEVGGILRDIQEIKARS